MSDAASELIELCQISLLEERHIRGVVIGTGLEQMRYIVLRRDGKIRCYINQCPHEGTPLETFPGKFLDESGEYLVCSTHGARFRVIDGFCVSGPCQGDRLDVCETVAKGDTVYLQTDGQD